MWLLMKLLKRLPGKPQGGVLTSVSRQAVGGRQGTDKRLAAGAHLADEAACFLRPPPASKVQGRDKGAPTGKWRTPAEASPGGPLGPSHL
jgi:hypothetical protein